MPAIYSRIPVRLSHPAFLHIDLIPSSKAVPIGFAQIDDGEREESLGESRDRLNSADLYVTHPFVLPYST